jgi:cell wall-associated NlpC family hydrolase
LATLASILVVPAVAHAGPTPPPNPTNGQLRSAQQQKQNLATEVGQLSGQVAAAESQLRRLQAASEAAQQDYDYAVEQLGQAKAAAQRARAASQAAAQRVVVAQQRFISYVQATYMSGNNATTAGALLTATDPNALLQQSTLQQYQAGHQLNAIGDLQRATVAKSNADAAARRAVAAQQKATLAAQEAKERAIAAATAAAQQTQALQASLAANQAKLQAAQLQLATLNNERAKFLAWQHEQAVLAARRRAERLRRERLARLAAERAAARRAAEERAAERRAARNHSGSPSSSSASVIPSGGGWTHAKGVAAAHRAENYLGTMYAWDGGNAEGPTFGVCAGNGAWNDCNVVGFDCSGLSLYAWAPSISLVHYAKRQYSEAGSEHPGPGDFEPGDLLFWSSDGTQSGIHHVAIYIGGGMVIQAPESGEVVQETPWDQVDWGYFGATRPLT